MGRLCESQSGGEDRPQATSCAWTLVWAQQVSVEGHLKWTTLLTVIQLQKKRYAAECHSTSRYVHYSEWGLRNYHPSEAKPIRLEALLRNMTKRRIMLLHLIVVHVHDSIQYVLFRLGITPPAQRARSFYPTVTSIRGRDVS
jgi:hypothetical protein